MEYRVMGRTGLKVSALAFGTMSFGNIADESCSAAMFAQCRDAGINYFDCANVYADGESERILGRLIAPHRDQVVISSKAYFPTGEDVNARGSSRFHLMRAVEESLARLGTDRIDIYYLHRFDTCTDIDESLRALDDLVRQGKILYPALSNYAAWQIAIAVGRTQLLNLAPIAAVQPMYNLVKRQAEVEILPLCAHASIGVFPYSPLGGGLLTGKYRREEKPENGRLVENKVYESRYGERSYYAAAEELIDLANQMNVHPATLAVAWVASHPAVTAPILGARNPEQLAPALAAATFEMSAELRARIDNLFPAPAPATDRSEEAHGTFYGQR